MRSTWPVFAAVVVAGAGVGVLIGRQTSDAGVVFLSADESTSTSTLVAPDAPDAPVVVGDAADPAPSASSASSLTPATVPETVAPTTTVPPTKAAAVSTSTAPPTTAPVVTTAPVPPSSEVPPTDAAPVADLRATSEVRVVLANGDGRYNLVGRNVDRLVPLGYVEIDQTDLSGRVDRTVVYHRDGFDREAVRLAADLLVPGALIEPLGDRVITAADALGDLIVVLGPDAVR